ncbi:hypothetical protein LCGC14_2065850 [marine sediment metagenome]|uniref:HTH marR-type domain-containing protein n=1 Tax=marine sediment metagenome TaxID=412755 RepID=A0A0F9F788_9ZZZZ
MSLGKNERKILRKLKKHKKLRSKEIFPNRKSPISSFNSLERKGLIRWKEGHSAKKGRGNLGYKWEITKKGVKQEI